MIKPKVNCKTDLLNYWMSFNDGGKPLDCASFYKPDEGEPFREFSNWFEHESFEFEIPDICKKNGFQNKVVCEFTEKALMLSKAACMGDIQAFELIKAAKDPEVCKQRGRQIKPWDEELWNKSVVQIAISMVYQKFTKVNGLKQVLMSTGDKIIVEATENDKNWGSGFNIGHEFEKVPSEWAKN